MGFPSFYCESTLKFEKSLEADFTSEEDVQTTPHCPCPTHPSSSTMLEGSHAQCAKLITSLSFSYSSRNILSQITWPEWNSGCATLCINIKRSKIA